ncbi:hypothetical protein GUJ93_ZPchr0009g391 [Zizania palustris]|uniref:Uncharacterized protein n=1 Tax=Zizania palustris TaxID=103762 RepID=A0A8J5RGP0_ZIZPA|nr:hypothetical protein GUJ93_ZPchr0009g391 [Zizania palustris]
MEKMAKGTSDYSSRPPSSSQKNNFMEVDLPRRASVEIREKEDGASKGESGVSFNDNTMQSTSDSGANVKCLEQETTTKSNNSSSRLQPASISSEVIQMLLRHVTTMKN